VKYLEKYGQFHHAGLAAVSLESSVEQLLELGYRLEGASFIDENQGVKGQFLTMGDHRIEVLSDLPGEVTVAPWLQQGELIPYHFGYLVNNLDSAISAVQATGMRLVRNRMPAVAFQGRDIAFLLSRSRLLIELIQQDRNELDEEIK
jgi:methylmalonyl-CoA/ethylmalonyl-CoA epimerase